jgi:peptidoglycan/xylan/chitin deacetylase (PgdA/CDA1 family)
VPAVVFVAAGVIDDLDDIWWHDVVVNGWNTGVLSSDEFTEFRVEINQAGPGGTKVWRDGTTILSILLSTAELSPPIQKKYLHQIEAGKHFAPPRQMLDRRELKRLSKHPLIEVGAHGYSHLPLTSISDPLSELKATKAHLQEICDSEVSCVSFPHGRYDNSLTLIAYDAGYDLLFTSAAVLNDIGRTPKSLFGRIGIPASQITDHLGHFMPDRLATWLFTRKATTSSGL